MSDPQIDALLEERRGYVLRGLDDRVKAVDDAIKAAGGKPPSKRRTKLETADVTPDKPSR